MSFKTAIRIIIGLALLAAVLYAVHLVLPMLGLPHPFPTLLMIVLAIIACYFIYRLFSGGGDLNL
jgi:hypothetical protein